MCAGSNKRGRGGVIAGKGKEDPRPDNRAPGGQLKKRDTCRVTWNLATGLAPYMRQGVQKNTLG